MTITRLRDSKGSSRYGNCTECGKCESDYHNLYRLHFKGVSIFLCPDCFRRTRIALNEISLEPTIIEADKEGMRNYETT